MTLEQIKKKIESSDIVYDDIYISCNWVTVILNNLTMTIYREQKGYGKEYVCLYAYSIKDKMYAHKIIIPEMNLLPELKRFLLLIRDEVKKLVNK